MGSPGKRLGVSISMGSGVCCSMSCKGSLLLGSYCLGLRLRGRALNGGPGLHDAGGKIVSRDMGHRVPLGGTIMGGRYGALQVGFTNGCTMRFHMFSGKITCHFVASGGNRGVIVKRSFMLGFPTGCGTRLSRPGNFGASCRCPCARMGARRCGTASHVDCLPVLLRASGPCGVLVSRTSLRSCPYVFLGDAKRGKVRSLFPGMPLRFKRSNSHDLGVLGRTSCVTGATNGHDFP